MAETKWKDSQLQVIGEREGEILVSASAGSGKTTVMIERLIRLIEEGVKVNEVLCLTFTESASQEIRSRLKKALIERLDVAENKDRYVSELDKLPFADISTIDAFCKRIVSRYFEIAGIDPTFSIASEDESKNVKYRTAEKTLSLWGEKDDDVYFEMLDFFGKKRSEESLLDIIIKIDEYLSSIANRENFVRDVIEQTEQTAFRTILFESEMHDANLLLRKITNLSLSAQIYGLPYTREVLEYVGRIESAKAEGYSQFFEEINKGIPQNPHYGRKPYTNVKESKEDITEIKELVWEFLDRFGGQSYFEIEKDLSEISVYAKKILDLVDLFRTEYEKAMERSNMLDFSMIENRAHSCLKNDSVREETVSRYSHVLVDEYQDTNKLQDEIILMCSGGKSLFMVGDAKQSIYEFRHAEPALFLEKRAKRGIKAHTLSENFRTDENLINGINRVFLSVYKSDVAGEDYQGQEMIPERKGISGGFAPLSLQVFFSQKKQSEGCFPPVYSVEEDTKIGEEDDEKEETRYVCDKIKQVFGRGFIKDKSGVERKIEYSDIAVLYRSRSKSVSEIVELLKKEGIPVSVTEKSKLPYSAELLIHLFKVIDNTNREDSLVSIMLSPAFSFSENSLAKYKLKSKEGGGLWKSLQSIRSNEKELDLFLTKIEDYKFRSTYMDVCSLADYVIKDLDFENKIVGAIEEKSELGELENYLTNLRSSKITRNLAEYLNYFEKYPEYNSSKVSGNADGVKFMTVHASKGLEFPVVFLVGCGGEFNRSDTKESILLHKKYGIAMPTFTPVTRKYRTNFFYNGIKRKMIADSIAQELRLLYVAMTRARNMLFISGTSRCASDKDFDKKKETSQANSFLDFLLIALNKDDELEKYMAYSTSVSEERHEDIVQEKETKNETVASREHKELLEFEYAHKKATKTSAKFTVTGILKSQDETPSVTLSSSESAEVGTVYHTVMQNIDFAITSKEEVEKALSKMLLDEIITEEDTQTVDAQTVLGVLNLPIIKEVCSMQVLREQQFLLRAPACDLKEGEIEDEVLLQGVIDLLALGDEPIIVDYKYSGASAEVLRKRYQKQLDLYGYAVKKILGKEKVRKYLISLKTGDIVEFKE